jgi:predicted enzyme related to lactoylglutathione lyase
MPKMTSYRQGVPSWVDVSSPDVEKTGGFYCGLFGWELTPDMGPEAGGYRLFLKGGESVAGIGPLGDGPPAWSTYFHVDDADEVAGRIGQLGGTLVVHPMDLPNESGRIAFGIDPCGGFFGLHQAGANHIGAAIVNEPGSLAWNELNVRDVDTDVAFYNELLGATTDPMDDSPDPYRLVKIDGRPVAGVRHLDEQFPSDIPTNWMPYFAVDDADASCRAASGSGGGVIMAPFQTPVGEMAVLHDPTGAVFAIGAFSMIDDPNNWG